jgi:hypothetical protein
MNKKLQQKEDLGVKFSNASFAWASWVFFSLRETNTWNFHT